VRQGQRVQFEGRGLALFVRLDHRAPASRIAAHRGQHQWVVVGDQAGIDQRAQQRDCAGGVAAGIGHAIGRAYRFELALGQFGKAEHPAGGCAVRGRGVDDLDRAAGLGGDRVHHGRGFARGVVVQAEDDQIDARDQRALGLRVLAQRGIDARQFDPRQRLQALANLQAGGAGLSVDEYPGHGVHSFSLSVRTRGGMPPTRVLHRNMIHLPVAGVVSRLRLQLPTIEHPNTCGPACALRQYG